MALMRVGKLTDLTPGSVMEVMIGEQPYAICRLGNDVRALSGICLHRGGPLGQGQIHDGRVVCPYHLWEFDCHTGEYESDPSQRVPTYEVRLENGEILLKVPESA